MGATGGAAVATDFFFVYSVVSWCSSPCFFFFHGEGADTAVRVATGPPGVSLLFANSRFYDAVVIVTSPPPVTFFNVQGHELSPDTCERGDPPATGGAATAFHFPSDNVIYLPRPDTYTCTYNFPDYFVV